MNIVEALQKEAQKGRDFLRELEDAAEAMRPGSKIDDHPGLAMSAAVHLAMIKQIEAVIAGGDAVEMVRVFALVGGSE